MAVAPLVTDEDASPEVLAIFADIRAVRGTDFINNFWRALAVNPPMLAQTWNSVKTVMGGDENAGTGALDPLTKELIYIAVSTANGCSYCVHSHTAAARAKGMSAQAHNELLNVIALASQTNALATALQVPTDPRFDALETTD